MPYYVGIDIGEEKHQVCIMDTEGRVLSELSCKHTWAGLQKLKEVLVALGEIKINLERSNGLLIDWLVAQNWQVYVTQPNVVAHRRPRKTKDDRGDAFLLAKFCRLRDPECRLLVMHSETVEELRQLTQAHDQLLHQKQRVTNQLYDVLIQYYPVVIDIFSRINQRLTLAFLEIFPTPEAAQAASYERLRSFFQDHGYHRYMRKVPEHYHKLQQPYLHARVQDGFVSHMRALVMLLKTLDAEIKGLEKQMKHMMSQHPEAEWWYSLPGSGTLTAIRLLARMGDDRNQFPTYQSLQTTAGTVPITRHSGKKIAVSFRQGCSKPLRRVAIDFAKTSLLHSEWAKSYFNEQLARGHELSRAYRALANRWLKIIWTLWQRRESYDEAYHVANRALRGQVRLPNVRLTSPKIAV